MTEEGNKKAYALSIDFWVGLITIVGFIALGLHYPHLRFAIFAWFLFIVQWSNFITLTQVLADRYASVSAIFIMYILAHYLIIHPFLALCILTAYIMSTMNTSKQYKNAHEQLLYHLYYEPDNIEARSYLAINLIRAKDYIYALAIIKEGLIYHPNDYRFNMITANCLKILNPKERFSYIDVAEKNKYIGDNKADNDIKELRS